MKIMWSNCSCDLLLTLLVLFINSSMFSNASTRFLLTNYWRNFGWKFEIVWLIHSKAFQQWLIFNARKPICDWFMNWEFICTKTFTIWKLLNIWLSTPFMFFWRISWENFRSKCYVDFFKFSALMCSKFNRAVLVLINSSIRRKFNELLCSNFHSSIFKIHFSINSGRRPFFRRTESRQVPAMLERLRRWIVGLVSWNDASV